MMAQQSIAQSYSFMEFYFRIGVSLNAVPFHYDHKNKIWSYRPRSVKKIIWLIFSLGGMQFEFCNVLAELIRGSVDSQVSRGELCLTLFIFLSWFLITKLYWNLLIHGHEIVNHLNQTLKLRQQYTEEALPKCNDHKVVRGHITSSMIQSVFQCMMVAAEGSKRQYIYSLVPESYRSGMTQALWSLYATWRVITNFQVGYFFVFVGVFHVQTVTQMLDYRKLIHEEPFKKLKSYRELQILCNMYNQSHSRIYMPSITIFAVANIILGNYGTLRFAGAMPAELLLNFPLMAFMMMILVFTFYPKNATVRESAEAEKQIAYKAGLHSYFLAVTRAKVAHENYCPTTEGMKGQKLAPTATTDLTVGKPGLGPGLNFGGGSVQKRREELRVLKEVVVNTRSCALLAVNMGAFYAIKRSTVLNIFQFIICNTISALLTWK